jgi:hypothetical protein
MVMWVGGQLMPCELSEDAKKMIDLLKESYGRLTDGVARNRTLPTEKGFRGDELISEYSELILVGGPPCSRPRLSRSPPLIWLGLLGDPGPSPLPTHAVISLQTSYRFR